MNGKICLLIVHDLGDTETRKYSLRNLTPLCGPTASSKGRSVISAKVRPLPLYCEAPLCCWWRHPEDPTCPLPNPGTWDALLNPHRDQGFPYIS